MSNVCSVHVHMSMVCLWAALLVSQCVCVCVFMLSAMKGQGSTTASEPGHNPGGAHSSAASTAEDTSDCEWFIVHCCAGLPVHWEFWCMPMP